MSKKQAPIFVIRRGRTFYPEYNMDAEAMEVFPEGTRVSLSAWAPRNTPRLRAYWAMIGEVIKATECAPNANALHNTIKVDCGYTDQVRLKSGLLVAVPSSIAFEAMEEPEMIVFMQHAERWIAENLGIDVEDLRREYKQRQQDRRVA